eukprot:752346-Hanusia_phi.AAC.4
MPGRRDSRNFPRTWNLTQNSDRSLGNCQETETAYGQSWNGFVRPKTKTRTRPLDGFKPNGDSLRSGWQVKNSGIGLRWPADDLSASNASFEVPKFGPITDVSVIKFGRRRLSGLICSLCHPIAAPGTVPICVTDDSTCGLGSGVGQRGRFLRLWQSDPHYY